MSNCPNCSAPNPDGFAACLKCGASAPTMGPPGIGGAPAASLANVIDGRFELRKELGRGGMGSVYLAWDRTLEEEAAVKVLHLEPTDRDGIDRVKREIITARRVTHKNVVRIHEFGLGPPTAFIAMEFLNGGTLEALLRKGLLPIPRAIEIAVSICDGLAGAHEKGVVHRDLKPANVLFDSGGVPKLGDFGLARMADSSKQTVGFSGTPYYMSPEQADSQTVTTKSDVYSMGVVLYEMFTGTLPFKADSLLRLALMHARQTPARPREIRPEIPEDVERILLDALQKDPGQRPSAMDLKERLAAAADPWASMRLDDRPPRPLGDDKPTLPPPRPAAAMPAAKKTGRARLLPLLLIAMALAPLAAWKLIPHEPQALPTPTPVAVTTSEAPAATASATPSRIAARPPKPSPAHSTVAIVSTPAPTPPPVGRGTLSITTSPTWVAVYVDEKMVQKQTPLRKYELPAGKHTVKLVNEVIQYENDFPVTIDDRKDTALALDLNSR